MLIWAIIATVVCIMEIGILIAYRRQVKKTCRHLEFMKNNQTNLRLRGEIPFKELDELAIRINELLDMTDEIRIHTERNENNLKEAITNISHDIRTPLTSLDGFFQLLRETESDTEKEQYIEIIQNRISNLKYMLEELFTYTKLQNEAYEIPMEPIDFNRCIYTTLVSFYNEFQEKGIEVTTDFVDEHVIVHANSEALQRIAQNLLKNILLHGSQEVRISLKREGEEMVFSCSNKVKEDRHIDVSQVFSRFYKSDPARTHSSTGLGLAIAKSLAERMNGTMEARMEDGWFSISMTMRAKNV